MSKIIWDKLDERIYESGVDHGVLYILDSGGAYSDGVPWNGLTVFTESPSGGEATAQYADNMKYLNLVSAEMFGATVRAVRRHRRAHAGGQDRAATTEAIRFELPDPHR